MIKLVVLDVDGTSIDRDNHFYDDDIKGLIFIKKRVSVYLEDMNMM